MTSQMTRNDKCLLRIIWFWTILLLFTLSYSDASNENTTFDLFFLPHELKFELSNRMNMKVSYKSHDDKRPKFNESLRVWFNEDNANIVTLIGANFTLTRMNREVTVIVKGNTAGHVVITGQVSNQSRIPPDKVNIDNAYINIRVYHSYPLDLFSDVIGWTYFFSWTFSFYPQIWENFQRKSVIGLNFDYLALNFVGHSCYNIFNIGMFWFPAIKRQYLNDGHEHGVNPVQINDLAFSMHAVFATLLTIVQACIYERGEQKVSYFCRALLGIFAVFLSISLVLAIVNTITWLQYLYYVSYVKLVITLVKCVPQAYLNFKRRSTVGWSIGNVLMDFVGGTLSCLQMFMIAYNYNDWSSLFGDPTKFGLGFFSVLFDILFMIQHYILYRNADDTRQLISPDQSTTSYDSYSENPVAS